MHLYKLHSLNNPDGIMKISIPALVLILISSMVLAQSNVTQVLANMSNAHISEIASGNINATLGSYITSPFVFVNMNYTNFSNTYYGRSGAISALKNITSYGTPYIFYIRNSSVIGINSTEYSVNRDVWFVSSNQTKALFIPYSATYIYSNGSWLIYSEWFGTNSDAGTATSATQLPSNLTTTTVQTTVTTINTTTIATPTSLLYTIPGQNATQNSTTAGTSQGQSPSLIIIVGAILAIGIVILYILTIRKK